MEEFYLIVIIAVAVVAGLFYSRWISRRVRHLEGIIKRTDEGDCVTTERMLIKGLIDDEDYRIIDKDVMVNKNLLCIPVSELNAKEQRPSCWDSPIMTNEMVMDEQKPVEWSEEDRLHYTNVLEALEYVKGCKSDYDKIEAVKSDIAWLESLRNRVGKEFLQPHWKPSEEQPDVFDTVAFQKGVQEGRRLERQDALTIADIEKLHTFLYAVKNNKHGAFTFTRLSDEQYEEVLQRFNNAKEK